MLQKILISELPQGDTGTAAHAWRRGGDSCEEVRRAGEDANSALSCLALSSYWRPIRLQMTPHIGSIFSRHTLLHFPTFVHFYYNSNVCPLMHNGTESSIPTYTTCKSRMLLVLSERPKDT
jgi:hypothetical protein